MLDSNLIIILSMYSNYYSITVFLSSLPISQTYTLLISILEWDHQTIVQWEPHFLYGEQNKKSMYYYITSIRHQSFHVTLLTNRE